MIRMHVQAAVPTQALGLKHTGQLLTANNWSLEPIITADNYITCTLHLPVSVVRNKHSFTHISFKFHVNDQKHNSIQIETFTLFRAKKISIKINII